MEVFSEGDLRSKLSFALESVKKSMKWDEDTFGLEYDLDVFNVVCVRDFNMGAMENKGLNIFNSSLLLADKKTTTGTPQTRRIIHIVTYPRHTLNTVLQPRDAACRDARQTEDLGFRG